MSDQTSIFNGNDSSVTQTQTNTDTSNVQNASTNAQYADLLNAIKNERGEPKYKSVEDALKANLHAQSFISTLQAEKAAVEAEAQRLREEAERVKTLEETLKALTTQQQAPAATTAPVIDESKIAELVNRTLTLKQQQELAKTNTEAVVNTLQQKFGTEAEKVFYGKAAELGMTVQEMNALAAKSPKAVLTMLGVTEQAAPSQRSVAPTTSTVNTSGFQPQTTSFVGRNQKQALVGATTQDVMQETQNARKMVEELHSQGKSVHDLTDPKVYFKLFGQ